MPERYLHVAPQSSTCPYVPHTQKFCRYCQYAYWNDEDDNCTHNTGVSETIARTSEFWKEEVKGADEYHQHMHELYLQYKETVSRDKILPSI